MIRISFFDRHGTKHFQFVLFPFYMQIGEIEEILTWVIAAGIYILKKIRNYTKTEIQNGETLPKLNIGI